jgi:hypothetical protein
MRPGLRTPIVRGMAEWSIEVFHGEFRGRQWQDAYSSMLIEWAVTAGATGWEWHEHRWGVVFEVEFGEDSRWETFRALPAVQAALDAVPDPVNGLLVYRGRGGGAGVSSPRRPRPAAGAGAMARARGRGAGRPHRDNPSWAAPPGRIHAVMGSRRAARQWAGRCR